jgi:predicted SAM-dependent methyltransferase
VRAFIRKLLAILHIENWARAQLQKLRLLAFRIPGASRKIKHEYFRTNATRRLHIGCGFNVLAGWLNTDFVPLTASVCYLDATKRLPFKDDTFDFVFSEHMIEHISVKDGVALLSECLRVMKRGGRIRIATPDLRSILALHDENRSGLQQEYIQWAAGRSAVWSPCRDAAFVINLFMREWGHQFIYDEQTLRACMEGVGFKEIRSCELGQSECEELRSLENEERQPAGFLRLESMVLEGRKVWEPRSSSTYGAE